MTKKWAIAILALAILVMIEAFVSLYIYSKLRLVYENSEVLDHNMRILLQNQVNIDKYMQDDKNSIKIQLPDGAQLVPQEDQGKIQ